MTRQARVKSPYGYYHVITKHGSITPDLRF